MRRRGAAGSRPSWTMPASTPRRTIRPPGHVGEAPETIALLQRVQPRLWSCRDPHHQHRRPDRGGLPVHRHPRGDHPALPGRPRWLLGPRRGRPDLVGTTVHLVDKGIDTGGILAQATFAVTARGHGGDLSLPSSVAGLPPPGRPGPTGPGGGTTRGDHDRLDDGVSRLYLHPTLWGYLAKRWTAGVR